MCEQGKFWGKGINETVISLTEEQRRNLCSSDS